MTKKSVNDVVIHNDSKNFHGASLNADTEVGSHLDNAQVENGVRLVQLTHEGEGWRLGAITPNWRNLLTSVGKNPHQEQLKELQAQGLWLAPEKAPPKMSVVCGGQGTIWQHMGRGLYDTFPAARAAMDRIAAVADWDILGLMDETDNEKLKRTRYQSPYIFLVSYAQFCYLESLGFKPDFCSGHSLGELMALCIAGAYSPEDAWIIFNDRSILIDDLEHGGQHDTGMMAVYAPQETIEQTLQIYPELIISNYNTPVQYILSGPKHVLAEARRSLRKQKIPAITLNVSMAFHHPHLRILRDHSIKELHLLDIGSTHIPTISNVTAGLYPQDKADIVENMADLDESAVRWVECVQNMWNNYNIRHFLELGPTDVISGLVADIEPRAHCLAVSRKDKEVQAMRRAVAELYALGHIKGPSNFVVPDNIMPDNMHICTATEQDADIKQVIADVHVLPHVEDILPILMEETGLERHKLAAHMDLRHDLAMRSSRFPVIIQKLESAFGIQINFEDIMHVTTIGDLAQVVANFRNPSTHIKPAHTDEKSISRYLEPELPNVVNVGIMENMQDYPYIYPIELTQGELPTFKARRNFSIYADAHLQSQHCQSPIVGASMILEALYAGANMAFSELKCHGADNINFEKPIVCAGGITREAFIEVEAKQWLETEFGPRLQCEAKLRVHDITANGKRVPSKSELACANILFVKNLPKIKPLWQENLQDLLEKQIINKYILPRKTFAEQCYSSYAWPSVCMSLLSKIALSTDKDVDIISISKMRHEILPLLEQDLHVFWQLQNHAKGYNLDAQVCHANEVVLTVQGMRSNFK